MLSTRSWILLCLALLGWLAGCANPNTYTTARSLPPNHAVFSIAPEAYGFGGTREGTTDFSGGTIPVVPSLGLRVGLTESVDVGVRANNLASLSGDVKWNFQRSQWFDAAIMPGVQVYDVPRIGTGDENRTVALLHAPLILDLNVTRAISFVPTLGVSYGFAETPPPDAEDLEIGQVLDGLYGRFGLGINLRVGKGFALHPEVTFLRQLEGDDTFFVYTAGLGFVFGKMPEF